MENDLIDVCLWTDRGLVFMSVPRCQVDRVRESLSKGGCESVTITLANGREFIGNHFLIVPLYGDYQGYPN